MPAQDVLPAGRSIQAAQQVQERAFSGAGGAHDGDEIPLGKIDRDAPQRAHDDSAFEDIVLVYVDDLGRHFHRNTDWAKRYSCRRASIGSILAARWAGYKPNKTPTTTEIKNAATIDQGAIRGSSCWMFEGSDAITSGNN